MSITLVAKPIEGSWLEAVALGIFVVAVVITTAGNFWMMWAAFRRGDLARVVVAAFVPFAYIWYYINRASQFEKEHLGRLNRIALGGTVLFVVAKLVADGILGY